MSFLLDTNICIFALRGHAAVLGRLTTYAPGDLAVSTITLAELWFGACKSRQPKRMRRLQDFFVEPLHVFAFTTEAAEEYADIRFCLERRGKPIGERDQMIAAIARAHQRILVTNNTREFGRVPRLTTEDWSEELT
jgi:tRNA(fMet)-specific endonuclease VapC